MRRVVEFSQGSKFYYELGNYYYYKNNLDRAMSYYKRALAVDPTNPVNHFNVACLLSELGKYRESISLFEKVTEMDSGPNESLFWLALNHGQLQQYKEACQYLRKYLEREPDGEYSWQAEEILDYLRSDLPMLTPGQRVKIDHLCTKGIDLISQGRMEEAIKCFSRASAIEPEMSAPKNNLALSWFYLGDMGKAIELTWEVLRSEPNNVFANCNLCTFYFIMNDELALRRQLDVMLGLWSDDVDEMLKLGTTYGLLGLDRKALDIFRHLHSLGKPSFEILLLLGIALYNCRQYTEATKVFDRVNALEPDNPYSCYRLLAANPQIKLPYHLLAPQPAIAALFGPEVDPTYLHEIKTSPDLWPQLLWLIRNGNPAPRTRLLKAITSLDHKPLSDMLAALVWDEALDNQCRGQIYDHLTSIGFPVTRGRYWNRGRFTKNRALVLEGVLADLTEQGLGFSALNSAYMAWKSFCSRQNVRIADVNLWQGALRLMIDGREQLATVAAEFNLPQDKLAQAVKKFSFFSL